MKASLIRSIAIFVAGAGTATLAAGLESYQDLTAGEWQEQAMVVAADLARLGAYVVEAKDGRVSIVSNPEAACVSPKPPVPNGPPDPQPIGLVRMGAEGVYHTNLGLKIREKAPVYVVDLCMPVNERSR